MPQPSGWPVFGFGWGHPKSRKFRPVSARVRNAIRVSTEAGLRLTIPSIRHMSAQLVADFPEERDPFLAVLLPLHTPRQFPDHDPTHATTSRRNGRRTERNGSRY